MGGGKPLFDEMLAQCRKNFGDAPRRHSLWDRMTYWNVPRPDWLRKSPDDKLHQLFNNYRKLASEGIVVWGHIIQANRLLFSPGRHDHPGEVVYSLDDSPIDLDVLMSVVQQVRSLKQTQPDDPDYASIAEYLTDEMIRVFGLPVPKAISPWRPHSISTVFFVRKHWPKPGQFLQKPLLPIVVMPNSPHYAMVLPERYWPTEYLEWWKRES